MNRKNKRRIWATERGIEGLWSAVRALRNLQETVNETRQIVMALTDKLDAETANDELAADMPPKSETQIKIEKHRDSRLAELRRQCLASGSTGPSYYFLPEPTDAELDVVDQLMDDLLDSRDSTAGRVPPEF